MTRRFHRVSGPIAGPISGPAARWALGACAGALLLSSCATFQKADDVAEVNGKELSEATFADMLESPVGADLLGSGPIDGVMAGDTARGLIGAWIGLNALDDAGFVTEEERATATEEIGGQYGEDWNTAPAELQDLAVLNGVIGRKAQSAELPEDVLRDAISKANISVSPRYGRWDSEILRVEPLG